MRLKIHVISFIFLSQPLSPTAVIKFVRRVTVINKLYIIEGKNSQEGGIEWYRDTGTLNNETKRQTLAEHQEKHTESEINLAIGQFPTTVAAVLSPRLILNTPVGITPIWACKRRCQSHT